MTTKLPEHTPKTILTLSAASELLPEDERSAAIIQGLIGQIARARHRGHQLTAARLEARLIEYVWGPAA